MIRNFFALLTIVSLWACKDDDANSGENAKIYFSGISRVDYDGSATASSDTTDWRSDDQWVKQESDLFATSQPFLCGSTDSIEIYAAQPNPCTDRTIIHFFTGSDAVWRFRFVDENFNLLDSLDWQNPVPGYNAIIWDTDSFPKDTVRLYYQIEKQGCMLRGHGDILIEN